MNSHVKIDQDRRTGDLPNIAAGYYMLHRQGSLKLCDLLSNKKEKKIKDTRN